MKRLAIILGIAVALPGFTTRSARAAIMDSSLTFNLTNFPGGVTSISSTIGNGLTTSGSVQVFSVQTSTPGGGEWDDFFFSTSNGGPLAANSALNWQIDALFTLSQAANYNGYEFQWTTSGGTPNGLGGTPVPLASLTPSGFINYAGNGPLGVGYTNGYGATGNPSMGAFSVAVAAGAQDFPTFVDPYSLANTNGGIPTDADGFNIAFHFDPQATSAPEPSTFIIWSLLLGSGGVGLLYRRLRNTWRPAYCKVLLNRSS
jgi:hypothetical protein